jgi:hypothetical protein
MHKKQDITMTMLSVTRALLLSALLLLISSAIIDIQTELLSTGEDVDAFVQKKIAGETATI